MIKIPQKYVKPLDYLFILRPSLFFPVWIMTLAGYETNKLIINGTSTWWSLNLNLILVLNFLLITLVSGATFIYNQIQDIQTDKENKKLFLISEKYVKIDLAKKIALYLIVISFIGLLIQDLQLSLLIGGVLLFWGYLYNFPPFQWKDKPIMGVLTNLIAGLLLFLAGWHMAGDITKDAFIYFIPYLCAWAAVCILTTIPDIEGDKKSQKKTIAIWLGIKTTVFLTVLIVIIGFIVGMHLDDPVITHSILLSLPIYLIMAFRPERAWILRATRYSILFLGLFLSILYPFFFIALIMNYYISRFYYSNRFGLEYPTFTIEEDQTAND